MSAALALVARLAGGAGGALRVGLAAALAGWLAWQAADRRLAGPLRDDLAAAERTLGAARADLAEARAAAADLRAAVAHQNERVAALADACAAKAEARARAALDALAENPDGPPPETLAEWNEWLVGK